MHLKTTAALAALIGGFSAASATALDFGPGFTLTGDIELEYLVSDGDDQTVGLTDLTLSWRSQSGGGLGFGFDLGVQSFHDFDDNSNPSILWGGLVLTTGFGEVTVGNPQPFLDTIADRPAIGGIDAYQVELGLFTGSSLSYFLLTAPSLDSYGVSFAGSSGDLSYGVALHRVEQGSDNAEVYSAMLAYSFGGTRVYAAFEDLREGGDSYRKIMLGGEYDAETFRLGANVTDLTIGATSEQTTELYAEYNVTDSFVLGAQVFDFASVTTLYGISGTYGFAQGGFAELGYATDDDGDDVVSASIGWKF